MRILFVGMARSVHAARWIDQLRGLGWELHFFPSDLPPAHPRLDGVVTHWNRWRLDDWRTDDFKVAELGRVVRAVRPDVVHAMSMHGGAWLALEAKRRAAGDFPTWLIGLWGGCLPFYGRLGATTARVRDSLAACDALLVESRRDITLARGLGYAGPIVEMLPVPGGMPTDRFLNWAPLPPSQRRVVTLRAQQDWTGRAFTAIAALRRCVEELRDYTVVLHAVTDFGVEAAAELQLASNGVRVESTGVAPHDGMMRLLGRARVCLQAKATDGLNVTLLEAMLMGAFPVQSDNGVESEWVDHGRTALLVDPNDAGAIAAAVRRALTDDALVDAAAEANRRLVVDHLDDTVIRPRVVDMYERLADGRFRSAAREPDLLRGPTPVG